MAHDRRIFWFRIVAEGVVIVVSILLAFGIDAWWDGQQRHDEERQVLSQLAQGLRVDREEFQRRLDLHRDQEADVIALVDDLRIGPESGAHIRDRLGSLFDWIGVTANAAPYESLKSSGLDLIASENLRLALIRYYENSIGMVMNAWENDRDFVQDMALPYAHQHFRHNRDGTWDPVDLEALSRDTYFANLCENKLRRLRRYIIPGYTRALAEIDALLAGIEEELAS